MYSLILCSKVFKLMQSFSSFSKLFQLMEPRKRCSVEHRWFSLVLDLSFIVEFLAEASLMQDLSKIFFMYKGYLSWKNLNTFAARHCLIVSSRVSAPPWNIDLTPFYLAPPPKKFLNLLDPAFMSNPPQNFGELDCPPWDVPLPKKAKTRFLKKQKILFPTMKWEHI